MDVQHGHGIGFLYILMTVLFTVYGQLVIKWQVGQAGEFPSDSGEKALFLARLLLNPWVISGLASAFLASLFWMATLTQFELSFAYPFTALSFIMIMVFAVVLFNEPFTWFKLAGTVLVVVGIFVASQ